ncbi:hypothetical protein GCM10023321_33510 [Pseudonocardia eucalypti]|uniref:Uncharacterized protein n=1 Tax=Pseudonocardia eucalypti TaxID=648755 RepID=A0ABP9Q7J8_9PSEU|nr:hypothetical protein [Pseudonocardia eucalypti]
MRYGAGTVRAPSNWDEVIVERRRRTLRRGSVVCLVVGLAFMLLAGVSLTSPPPPPPPAAPVAPPAPPR